MYFFKRYSQVIFSDQPSLPAERLGRYLAQFWLGFGPVLAQWLARHLAQWRYNLNHVAAGELFSPLRHGL